MILIDNFIKQFSSIFIDQANWQPWQITNKLAEILNKRIAELDDNFDIQDGIAVHKTATIENNVTLKPPVIIGKNCFIGANAYLRGGIYLDRSVIIGPCCEIKTSIVFR